MSAVIGGLVRDLSIGLEKGEKHVYGPARRVDYYCSGAETPPCSAPYFISVYGPKIAKVRYPRVVATRGEAPPQYPDPDDFEDDAPTYGINAVTGAKVIFSR